MGSESQNFNGAMAVRPWMDLRHISFALQSIDFNGAMAVRPWMGRRIVRVGARKVTSMGPWP